MVYFKQFVLIYFIYTKYVLYLFIFRKFETIK